jgi:predicted NAD/FAD-dependent oxidoreductase
VKKLTIIGAGWSGLACAVAATHAGWQVELFEAASEAGGRARSLVQTFAGVPLDNGQHILLGAYRDTLQLMRTVGVNPDDVLLRLPLDLRTADGLGFKLQTSLADGLADFFANSSTSASDLHISLPASPFKNIFIALTASWKFLSGVAFAKGWKTQDKWRLIEACQRWQVAGFTCDVNWSVAQLCEASQLTPKVVDGLIEPLCLSALNMPLQSASAAVFLRVLHDAMFSGVGSSDLLIPKTDLGTLFPQACLTWLRQQGAQLHLGSRFTQADLAQWLVASYEVPAKEEVQASSTLAPTQIEHQIANKEATSKRALVLACPAWEAARLTQTIAPSWSAKAEALSHTSIATVYLQCHDAGFRGLNRPMVALHMHPSAPAQFVFDRGALCQQHGLLAAVVSASEGEREDIAKQVQQQVAEQLGLKQLSVVQTVVEKRATFACLPNTFEGHNQAGVKPDMLVAPHIFACGDYVRGPYPATLEGAVRSGQQVVRYLG